MNRLELEKYILETYPSDKDYPWTCYPDYAVFRHNNKKSFAIVMDISRAKLGLPEDSLISVVNLKCSPIMIGSQLLRPGCFPAYHMNKEHWISVALDGSVADEELKMLVDMSFEATSAKKRKGPGVL